MTTFCGRTICNILTPDGTERIALFNSAIKDISSIYYYDTTDGNNVDLMNYKMVLTGQEMISGQRCLHYARYDLNNVLEMTQRIVPMYTKQTEIVRNGDSEDSPQSLVRIVRPIYETISPSILDIEGSENDTILFWSNCSEDLSIDYFGHYMYDPDKIFLFDENNLEEADTESSSIRILCSAMLTWEIEKTNSSLVYDSVFRWVPMIQKVNVIGLFTDGMIVDFSNGSGNGGGFGRHNHSNNNQCGFAYAVAAPGTSLNPVNWK